jgi:anti-sigma factor RsiW
MSETSPGNAGARPYITCEEVLTFLWAYLEGELSEDQRHEFERHFGVCPSCIAYLETYKKAIALGRQVYAIEEGELDLEKLPDDLVQAVLTASRTRAE